MSPPWQDRQRQAAITTPDGTRFEFLYEDVERSRPSNNSIHMLIDKSGAIIQRPSNGPVRYPLQLIFSGPDYDLTAKDFWDKTAQIGSLLLEHPRFKVVLRVAILSIKERRAAKTADNQVTFDLSLIETLEQTAPSTEADAVSKVLDKGADVNKQAANAFADNVALENPTLLARLQDKTNNFLDNVNDKLESIAAKEAAIKAAFDAQYLSAKSGVGQITSKTVQLANNIAIFITTPSRVATDIQVRIQAYKNLQADTFEVLEGAFNTATLKDTSDMTAMNDARNSASLGVLVQNGVISAISQSAVSEADYKTRIDVINVIDEIIDIADQTTALIDDYSDLLNQAPDPAERRFEITDATKAVNELTSLVTAQLFAIAFTLKQERVIILDRDRDAYSLTHELYGYSDENLQLLIDTNKIKGDSIFIIPQGTEIVYYI